MRDCDYNSKLPGCPCGISGKWKFMSQDGEHGCFTCSKGERFNPSDNQCEPCTGSLTSCEENTSHAACSEMSCPDETTLANDSTLLSTETSELGYSTPTPDDVYTFKTTENSTDQVLDTTTTISPTTPSNAGSFTTEVAVAESTFADNDVVQGYDCDTKLAIACAVFVFIFICFLLIYLVRRIRRRRKSQAEDAVDEKNVDEEKQVEEKESEDVLMSEVNEEYDEEHASLMINEEEEIRES